MIQDHSALGIENLQRAIELDPNPESAQLALRLTYMRSKDLIKL